MKVGLVVLASNENLYLRDFVEYYKNLGIDQIILGDNSPKDGDYPQLVIGDYIDSGFVKYINYRGYNENNWQIDFYNKTVNAHKKDFDWIAVFDVDEYLTFNDKNIHTIKEFLESQDFSRFGHIKINWRVYNDNGKLYYENKPVMERFTNPSPINFLNTWVSNPFPENSTTKPIVNCSMDEIIFKSPHVVHTKIQNMTIAACNPSGEMVNFQSGGMTMDYRVAQLNHYQSLSISEFLYRRLSRNGGTKLPDGKRGGAELMLKVFWGCNEKTEEKQRIIDNFLKNINNN